jgi:hypothetical protein
MADGLIGYQTPRLEHYPAYFTTLGDDAIDLCGMCGIDLLPWEEMIVRNSMGQTVDNRWAAKSVLLIAPRQNGKNVCVYARQLAGVVLLGERIMHSAHEFDTARDAHRELTAFIGNCEELEDEFLLPHKVGAAEMSIRHKDNGGFIHYVARGKNAKRGRTKIDLMVLDEAFALEDAMMGSLSPLQQASMNPQTWFTTSAGTEDSEVLIRMRERGKLLHENPDPDAGLMFAEWGCEEGSDPHDFENWKRANPSLGVRGICPVDAIREDYEMKMSLQQFAREHLGMWDDPAMSAIIDLNAWKDGCTVDRAPDDGLNRAICVDVSPDRQRGSIAIAEWWPDGRRHVEVVAADSGTNWIIPTAQKLITSSNPPKVCALQLGGQAGVFGPELEQIGYKVKYFGTTDIAHATMQFEDDIYGGRITHIDDPALLAGLAGASKYNIGNPDFVGGWGWLRKSTSIDITGIVACSYANRVLTLEGVEETLNTKKPGRLLIGGVY